MKDLGDTGDAALRPHDALLRTHLLLSDAESNRWGRWPESIDEHFVLVAPGVIASTSELNPLEQMFVLVGAMLSQTRLYELRLRAHQIHRDVCSVVVSRNFDDKDPATRQAPRDFLALLWLFQEKRLILRQAVVGMWDNASAEEQVAARAHRHP